MPAVSVVVLNWNGKDILPIALDSLRAQTFRDFEVIVVDNGSRDGSVAWVREHYPEARVVPLESNLGVPGGINAGFWAATAPLVAHLGNDAEAASDWLERLVEAAAAHPEVDEFACRVMTWHHRDLLDSVGIFARSDGGAGNRFGHQPDGPQHDEERELIGAAGVAVLYRKRMLEALGGMDEDFFAYYEDVDLSFRARLAGYRCRYVPRARAYHVGSATTSRVRLGGDRKSGDAHQLPRGSGCEIPERDAGIGGCPQFSDPLAPPVVALTDFTAYQSLRNRILYVWKDFPTPLLLRSLPVLLAAQALLALRYVQMGRARVWLRAVRDALRRLPLYTRKRAAVQAGVRVDLAALAELMEMVTLPDLIRRRKPRRPVGG